MRGCACLTCESAGRTACDFNCRPVRLRRSAMLVCLPRLVKCRFKITQIAAFAKHTVLLARQCVGMLGRDFRIIILYYHFASVLVIFSTSLSLSSIAAFLNKKKTILSSFLNEIFTQWTGHYPEYKIYST